MEKPIVQPPTNASEDTAFVDFIIVLAKHKKKILFVPVVMMVIMAIISLFLPNVYRANTRLLPPQQAQSSASALLAQLGGAASLVAGATGLKNPSDVYIGMLRSRTLADRLINKYELKNFYGTDSQEKSRQELASNTLISSGKDGLISIEVDSRDPTLAATLANGYVAELTMMTKTLAITEASQRRLFFQDQLEQAKNNLAKAEISLKGAINAGGMVSVDSESKTVVETIARLRAQVTAHEVELNGMQAFLTPDHPQFRRVSEALNSLRGELAKLENGRGNSEAGQSINKNGLENIQRLRELKYHQILYELLAKQYEAARLDEAKDSALIQVLDPALEPEHKVGPKRALLVILTALISFVAMVFWAFVLEAQHRAVQQPHVAARWEKFRDYLGRK